MIASIKSGVFIVLTDVKPNRNKVAERDRRDGAGLCVNCGEHPGFDKEGKPKPRKLGCCRSHYEEFTDARDGLKTEEEKLQFTARCIRECLIMPDRQGQRIKPKNAFQAIADEVK